MKNMNISLTDDMKAFVDEQVRERGFMSSGKSSCDLIRDQKEIAKIVAGMEPGKPQPAREVMERLRDRVRLFDK